MQGLRRSLRGFAGLLRLPLFPLRHWWPGLETVLDDPLREPDGLTLLFTGIQGYSGLEAAMALGLADAGVPGRIAIVDWTTGNPLRLLEHLRDSARIAAAATRAVQQIVAHRQQFPTATVNVVGYSGGAAVVLKLLAELPPDVKVTRAALLAAAVSPQYPVAPLVDRTQQGLADFRSRLDWPVLGLFMLVAGTCDGVHTPAAGLVGFDTSAPRPTGWTSTRFGLRWLRQYHYGGHAGYANRVWACETLGRWLAAAR